MGRPARTGCGGRQRFEDIEPIIGRIRASASSFDLTPFRLDRSGHGGCSLRLDQVGSYIATASSVLPGLRGLDAWRSLLRTHATLMRQLEMDLDKETGLTLADFDVLCQLAAAGGELRMTDLAARAFMSRSGMTRRVARLVDRSLVRRTSADADARGVVVPLIDARVARLTQTAPVHARGISELFVTHLPDQELAALESMLHKVTLDCSFGCGSGTIRAPHPP